MHNHSIKLIVLRNAQDMRKTKLLFLNTVENSITLRLQFKFFTEKSFQNRVKIPQILNKVFMKNNFPALKANEQNLTQLET